MRRGILITLSMALVCSPAVVTTAEAQLFGTPDENDLFGSALAAGDFDGDGYDDIAVGAPNEFNKGVNTFYGGQVHVVYGASDGLDPQRQQVWDLITMGVHPFDQSNAVGQALASGDFNDDGYDDLAIGAPFINLGPPNAFAGVVHILYGSENGLIKDGLQSWYQNRDDLQGFPEAGDSFGWALSVGNFDGDDYADLAIGIPLKNVDDIDDEGSIMILFGSSDGLDAEGHQIVNRPPGPGSVTVGAARWGQLIASGDINGDGFDDLAGGMPVADVNGIESAGAVGVLFGSPNGLTQLGRDLIYQSDPDITGGSETADWFGAALTIADFGTDGFMDLVVGIPLEDIGADDVEDEGALLYFFGSQGGVARQNHAFWSVAGVPLMGLQEHRDLFGSALAAGDFDGDGDADLAVGEPGNADVDGGVHVILSRFGSISVVGNTLWTKSSDGVPGEPNAFVRFGEVLATGDFNGDAFADIAVGEPHAPTAGRSSSGAMTILYGSAAGITGEGSQYFHQNLAPTASEIILPADGAVVLVGGTDNPIDPQTPLVIVWTAAEDPESQPIQYWWQVSSNAAFDDTLATVSAGTVNQLPTTLGYLGGLMRASGVEFDATVTWYHRIIAFDGADYVTGPAIAVTLTLGAFVSNETDLPVRAQLFGNYPNPFSGSTSIGYQTDEAGEVRLAVYDVRGAIVQSAAAWFSAPGTHTFHVRGDGLAAGVYLYTIRGGGLMGTGRLVRVER